LKVPGFPGHRALPPPCPYLDACKDYNEGVPYNTLLRPEKEARIGGSLATITTSYKTLIVIDMICLASGEIWGRAMPASWQA
jgi:hypothetical protein